MLPTFPQGIFCVARRLLRSTFFAILLVGGAQAQIIDTIVFGDSASETAHGLNAPQSQVISGGLGQSARKMLLDPADMTVYEGGYLDFSAKCDPLKLNYVTLKLWGSDTSATASGILLLYQIQDGQLLQVGYRDQQVSEFAPLAWATRPEMTIPGRFYYTTIPLPLSLTQGRTSVQLRVVGSEMNANGSLPVYRAYVHGSAYFEPAASDPQGTVPGAVAVRPSPSGLMQAALDKARQTTISNMNSWLANNNGDLSQLTAGYNIAWTPAYQNPLVPPRVVARIDTLVQGYFANPAGATDNAGADHGWGGAYGDEAILINQIGTAGFGNTLDQVVDLGDPAGPGTRRDLWAKAFVASRNVGQFSRRGPTTNQSIISDKNFYEAHKALQTINSPLALPEDHAKRFLLESVGLLPWLGSDNSDGTPSAWMGNNYYLVTPSGLTKEDGYVSAYGEIYDTSMGYYAQSGDDRFRTRGVEMFKARSYFRYPMVDEDGYRSFRMVGPLDWRSHEYFPFDQAYGERGTRLSVALATKDPTAIGYARQMFEDGQGAAFGTDLSSALSLETLVNEPDSGKRLPMTEGQPDFAWADVDNGIVAIKRGEELTWIEPYWQSRTGLHSIARAMQITPTSARLATVRSDLQFPWNGSWSSKVDGTGWNGVPLDTPNGLVHQAYFGDKILQPVPPSTAPTGTTREEFIGRSAFYATRYGRYLIGINMDKSNSYVLKTPVGFSSAMDLITRQTKSGMITVGPVSAVVLDLGTNIDPSPLPHAPKFIDAASAPGAVAVTWETSGGSTSYNVKRATSATGAFTTIATGVGGNYPLKWGFWPSGTYFDSSAVQNTTYYYKVSGTNSAGEGYDSPVSTGGSPTTSVTSVNTLPTPWKNVNFSTGGSASYNSTTSTFTLTGGGGDFWNTADGGHFVYQAVIGDGDIVARLTNQGGAYKTGVMIRASLATNSPEASILAQSSGVSGFKRTTAGGGSNFFGGDTRPADPIWLKLERRGKNVEIYYAPDASGVPGAWSDRGTATLTINSAVYIGIATTSGTPAYDNVSVNGFYPASASVPAVPANVSATPGNGSITLAWTPTNGASTYTVKRAASAAGPFTTIVASGLTSLSYTNSGLTNGIAYFYVVVAANPKGEGASSAVVNATPTASPATPTNLVVAPSGTQAVLTWTASGGATSYSVLRSSDGVSWTTVATVTGTSYTDIGLVNGQAYFYAVAAANGNGSSASTASVTITAAPSAPRLLDARGAGTQARLQWEGVSGATSYRLSRATSSGGTYNVVASGLTSLNYQDAGLTNKAAYFYTVTASNAAGDSVASIEMKLGWGTGLLGRYYNTANFSGVPVLSRIDPEMVTDWSQSSPDPAVNPDNFSVRWTGQFEAPATGSYNFVVGAADDYFFLSINGVTLTKNQSVTTTLTAGQKYDIQVDFADTGGAAYYVFSYSFNGGVAQTFPVSRLYPASLLVNRATGGTASANSPASATSAEGAAKAFDGSASTKWLTGVNGVTGWLQYHFATGVSWAITQYTITSANDVSQRDPKSWQLLGSNDGASWSQPLDTQTNQTFSGRGVTNTYTISNTTAYAYYRLNITANSGGSGYGIQLAEFGLFSAMPPAPASLSAISSVGQIALNWSTVSSATGYMIKRSVYNGGPYTRLASVSSGSSYIDNDVGDGITYYYVVSSTSASGEGTNSNEVSGTPGNLVSKLTGSLIGTAGTWGGGNTKDKAMDGNITTFFDAPGANATGAWVGIDLGQGVSATVQEIRFAPRTSLPARMVNGVFQGANQPDFSNAVALDTVTTTPVTGVLTSRSISSPTAFRYLRYLSAGTNSYGNIAEVEFYGTLSAPNAPAGLTATGADRRVQLAWQAAPTAASYDVKRAASAAGPFTTIFSGTSATSATDLNLTNGVPVYYVVAATSPYGKSPDSASATATPHMTWADYQQTYGSGTATADDNQDGITNLEAYAFGLDPLANAANLLPVATSSSGHLSLIFQRRKLPTDITYTVEVTGNLSSWNSGPSFTQETGVQPIDAEFEQVTVQDLLPETESTMRAMRVRISQ